MNHSNSTNEVNYVETSSCEDFAYLNQDVICNADSPIKGSMANRRSSTLLTSLLLEDIKKSVFTFKPSSSLQALTSLTLDVRGKMPTTEIDVVISGGGLKGYFMAGCSSVLLAELKKQNISIARIAGASAGAWAGMFMICNFNTTSWIETYHLCKERPKDTIHTVYEDIKDWVISELPSNAFEICTGRLFVSITVITSFGIKNKIISEFKSNLDLINCCMASSTLPFITEAGGLRRFRGDLVCDGGITNNCPVFPDGERRQLVFRLFDVEYPYRFIMNPLDSCIDALVIRGALLMARFLQGEPSDAIAWLEKKEQLKDLKQKRNYCIRGLVVAPVTVLCVMLFRGSGMSGLVKAISSVLSGSGGSGSGATGGAGTVIPFHEAAKYFNPAPLAYIAGAILAAAVDVLRSLNLLI